MVGIHEALGRARHLYGDRAAVHDNSGSISFSDLARRVDSLRASLYRLGLRAGDRVALLDVNSRLVLECYYAAAESGLVLVPLNTRLSVAELAAILQDCGPRAIVAGRSLSGQLRELKTSGIAIDHWIADGADDGVAIAYDGLLHHTAEPPPKADIKSDDVAQIFYTSGTTGKPKGACLTFGNMTASAIDVIVGLELGRRDIWLHAAPMFHLVDAWSIFAMPMLGAAQVVLHFSPDSFFVAAERWKPTAAALPPTLINMLCLHARQHGVSAPSLRAIMYGGSPMPLGVLQRAQEFFSAELIHSYGTTETSGTLTIARAEPEYAADLFRQSICAGQPVLSVGIDILGDDGPLPAGEIGEITISGPRLLKAYWNNPVATQAAMIGGRYHTGDLGYVDSNGYLFIVGRKKDMIITGGENVYPAEVENILTTHPDIIECAVIGVPHELWGQSVHAVVVASPQSGLTEDSLKAFCRQHLAGYKVPKTIQVTPDPLPKLATGKVARGEVQVAAERLIAADVP